MHNRNQPKGPAERRPETSADCHRVPVCSSVGRRVEPPEQQGRCSSLVHTTSRRFSGFQGENKTVWQRHAVPGKHRWHGRTDRLRRSSGRLVPPLSRPTGRRVPELVPVPINTCSNPQQSLKTPRRVAPVGTRVRAHSTTRNKQTNHLRSHYYTDSTRDAITAAWA